MHPVLQKTFGGLSLQYFIRQFLFGLIWPAMAIFLQSHAQTPWHANLVFGLVVNTLLYPYSRFLYESVVCYIVGNNIFLVPVLLSLSVKFLTMALCWCCAIFMAPIGLIYLYLYHSRATP